MKIINLLIGKKDLELICSNPECRKPIRGNKVAWNFGYNEFYHINCVEYAMILKAFNSGEIVSGEIYYLTQEQALKVKSKLDILEMKN